MRVLKLFFTSLFILVVVGVVGGLISREVLLSIALNQLKSDIRYFSKTSTASGEFFKNCLEYSGSFDSDGSIIRNQVRFTSPSDYVLESVCIASESVRKIIKHKSLPPLVRRATGSSGLVYGQSGHGLEVAIFGRSGIVYEEENVVFSTTKFADLGVILNDGPATVCSGYGYLCCDENFQSGQDFYQPNALDCPRSCYASCTEKPVVLTFNSEPAADETKIVTLNSGDFIEFIYTVSDINGDAFSNDNLFGKEAETLGWLDKLLKILNKYSDQGVTPKDEIDAVTISFGDGTSQRLLDLHGRVEHTYTCNSKSVCVYNVTIQAITKQGVLSTLDGVSKMQIQVRN
jgi:hypothetical protein